MAPVTCYPYRSVPIQCIRWLPVPARCPNCEHPLFLELDNRNIAPMQLACPRCDYSFEDVKARPTSGITESERLQRIRHIYQSIISPEHHEKLCRQTSASSKLDQLADIDAIPDEV